jgi:hypothetical protein
MCSNQENGVQGKPLLKKFSELRLSDFEKYPVWVNCHVIDYEESWYDDTDEETFRPWLEELPVDPGYTMFLVKSTLTLNDGTVFCGFITPLKKSALKKRFITKRLFKNIFTEPIKAIKFIKNGIIELFKASSIETNKQNLIENLGYIQPYILHPSGEMIYFWCGYREITIEEIKSQYKLLEKTHSEIFPVQFKAESGLSTGISSGEIFGFYCREKNGEIKIVR